MASAILVDGRPIVIDAPVKTSAHYKFTALAKRSETHFALWHWTAGVGGGPQVFRTLQERGLSCHFLIEPMGEIWQYADAALRCAHGGPRANSCSIGIEMTNPATRLDVVDGFNRQRLEDRIHGKRVVYQAFTAPQMASARALARTLSLAFGLPLDVPRESDGSAVGRVLSNAELSTFRGHAAHHNITDAKLDTGPRFLDSLVPAKASRS